MPTPKPYVSPDARLDRADSPSRTYDRRTLRTDDLDALGRDCSAPPGATVGGTGAHDAPLVQSAERCALPGPGGTAGVGGLAPPPHRRRHRPGRVLPVVFVSAILEDEERFGAMCGCFGERDGFGEAFERERLASGDAQHVINDETANLGQRAQRICR